jgi:hypothetical protein
MSYHVYAAIYSLSGRFLTFRRPQLSYFSGAGEGDIFPDGRKLEAGGRTMFPMAHLADTLEDFLLWEEDAAIIEVGQRLLADSCGAMIEFLPASAVEDGPLIVDAEHATRLAGARSDVVRFECSDGHYAGYHLEVDDADLDHIRAYLIETISEARGAMFAILNDDIFDYAELRDAFPHAPNDNLHASVDIWQLDVERLEISGLKSIKATRWMQEAVDALELTLATHDA